ncbi:hypothetical protein ACQZV8_13310 [Magnetococcales bacterium HHB-1]
MLLEKIMDREAVENEINPDILRALAYAGALGALKSLNKREESDEPSA